MLDAWVDGRLVPADQATVSVFDRGFRTGEGVFESLRSYGGHVFRLDAHLDRAARGAAALGIDVADREEVREAVTAVARANVRHLDGDDAILRLTLTPGPIAPDSDWPPAGPGGPPTVVVVAHRLRVDPATYERGFRAVTVRGGRSMPQVKAVSYVQAARARARAAADGADEAVFVDADDVVLEGAGSNVFAVVDDDLVTAPVEAGILAGVTRGVVLEVAGAAGLRPLERALTVAELRSADEAVLTMTSREVVPLVAVDGAPIGAGRPGPRAAALLGAFRAEVDRERRRGNPALR